MIDFFKERRIKGGGSPFQTHTHSLSLSVNICFASKESVVLKVNRDVESGGEESQDRVGDCVDDNNNNDIIIIISIIITTLDTQ